MYTPIQSVDTAGLLISGDADELGDSIYGASSKEIQLRERVKRELTESKYRVSAKQILS